MSVYIERVLQAVEDLRAFDRCDAERLADEVLDRLDGRHNDDERALLIEHLVERLGGHIDRETVLAALREVL
jgi:hypothetical protein